MASVRSLMVILLKILYLQEKCHIHWHTHGITIACAFTIQLKGIKTMKALKFKHWIVQGKYRN